MWRERQRQRPGSAQTQIAGDTLMHSQRIGKAAPNAIQGNPDAFAQLDESRARLNARPEVLANGGESAVVASCPPERRQSAHAARVRRNLGQLGQGAGTILKMQPELTGFRQELHQLDALSPELLALTEELLTQNVEGRRQRRANWPRSAA